MHAYFPLPDKVFKNIVLVWTEGGYRTCRYAFQQICKVGLEEEYIRIAHLVSLLVTDPRHRNGELK